jgi:uncharacterized membrane protein
VKRVMLKPCARHRALAWFAIVVLALLALADLAGLPDWSGLGCAHAQSGGGYTLDWYTTDGSGYIFSASGGYSLGGTIGQPDAGGLSGGGYTLVGGFWGGSMASYKIYLPTVLKSS